MKAELTNSGSERKNTRRHTVLIILVGKCGVSMCDCGQTRLLPLSQLMDRSVRMRSCSGPVAREMSKSVPRKLLVAAV